MNCTICGRPITLKPTAEERAAKYGAHPASYYTALFTEHSQCILRKRLQEERDLLQRAKLYA